MEEIKRKLSIIEQKEFYLTMVDTWGSECQKLSEELHEEKMKLLKQLKEMEEK